MAGNDKNNCKNWSQTSRNAVGLACKINGPILHSLLKENLENITKMVANGPKMATIINQRDAKRRKWVSDGHKMAEISKFRKNCIMK